MPQTPFPCVQILALIAMEKPVSGNADDIRDEKVKVIRCIKPVEVEDTVLAQYSAANDKPGYLDDETVPKDSKAPTFATTVLHVHNERWVSLVGSNSCVRCVICWARVHIHMHKLQPVHRTVTTYSAPLHGVNTRLYCLQMLAMGQHVYQSIHMLPDSLWLAAGLLTGSMAATCIHHNCQRHLWQAGP
jgi:hypothetical protein